VAVVVALRSGGGHADVAPPEVGRNPIGWTAPNANLAGTRAVRGSSINATNVAGLRAAWRFRFAGYPTAVGIFASTPLVLDGRVYLQDLDSDVFALDARTGRRVWRTRFLQVNGGPNGLAAGYGRIYGNTSRSSFALDSTTGKLVWLRRLTRPLEQAIDIAPQVAGGLVYTSTTGLPPGGKGAVYALDAATGELRWRFGTILGNWAVPSQAAGGGAWWTGSVDADGRLYIGNSNPFPWGGTPRLPNGGAYRGPDLYTDSLLVLHGSTGTLLWYDQAIAHDVRDYDLAASPILADLEVAGKARHVVFGAGKGGVVYAWDRKTGRRLWQAGVGIHRNDTGALPKHRVLVCPGLFGGVETPMAYSAGRLFVPVVDLCMRGSATGYEPLEKVDVAGRGRGELTALDAATGRPIWTRRFPAPTFGCATVANDVVFTATLDGRVYGLATSDGHILWRAQMRAGINSCPAVSGDQLLVGAGTDYPTLAFEHYELVAFRLP
jgi:alcohol dehydrogenase (cytochrome c)